MPSKEIKKVKQKEIKTVKQKKTKKVKQKETNKVKSKQINKIKPINKINLLKTLAPKNGPYKSYFTTKDSRSIIKHYIK